MGRHEKPVDPDAGPVQRLAHELRVLREKAGKPPYREMAKRAGYSTTTLSQAAAGDQLPTLAVVRAYAEALEADPDEWEQRWREADAEIRVPAPDERPPYRGLARFEPADSDLFFGRKALVDNLLELVSEHRFAAVFGASGSGKSSLLRAGLIPRLRQADGTERPAVIRVLAPGAQPARTHEKAFVPLDGESTTWVIVDQFEELFTLCHDRAERDRFLDLLLAARRPESRLRVAVAVRGDFYGHCADHRELAEAVRRASLLVGPMNRDELREAITGPATAADLNVERALTARIIEEVVDRPGALPMLSHALLETWRRRHGRLLTLAGYEETGGVHGAIAATAEQVYGGLSAERSSVARRILLRLIAPGDGTADTRRPASRAELGSGVREVLEQLVAARLVTLDGDTVELAHEALITGWPRLAGWIEESRERLRVQRRLGEAAHAWEELDHDPGALYRGTRLARAQDLFAPGRDTDLTQQSDEELTSVERSFLTASLAARDTEREAVARAGRRTRSLVVGLTVFLVLALTAGLVAWQRNEVSQEEASKAAARRLATVADGLRSTDPRTAALLGVASWKIAPLTESRSALLAALAQPERDAFTDPRTGKDVRRFLSTDGRTLLSVDGTTVTARNVADHKVVATYRLPSGTEANGAGPNSQLLDVLGPDGGERLWNLPSGRSVAELGDTPLLGSASDGSAYLTGPADGAGTVQVYRTDDGKALFSTAVARSLSTTAVGPGGRLLALCPSEGPLQVWNTADGERLPGDWEKADKTVCGTGSGADGGSRLLTFSGDGNRLAALYGTSVLVWDARSGRRLAEFAGDGVTGFTDAALSPDGQFLATADDQGLAVWRLVTGGTQVFHQPLSGDAVSGLTWDPGRDRLLRYLDGATVHTLGLADRLTPQWHSTPVDAGVLSPDGSALATVTRSGNRYRFELRSTNTGTVVTRAPLGPLPNQSGDETPLVAFSPDGRTVATADTMSSGASLRLRFTEWDVRTRNVRTVIATSGAADRPVTALSLGPDGHTLLAVRATAGGDTTEIWDTRSHRRSRTVPGLSGTALAVRPDGGILVGSDDQYADPGTGKVGGRALADGRDVTALAFSPDGTRLAVGDSTGHVTLWDAELRHRTGALTGTSDTDSRGEPEAVRALAFSSDSDTLAVGSTNGTLRLWDAGGQQLLGSDLPTSGDEIRSLAFTEDGGTVYASGPSVPLQRLVVAPERAVRTICARTGGGLTKAQWRTYVPDSPYEQLCQSG
ncbi:helix-turn-helix domain-containing protein [Streptomyces phyllanthi]|uniref:Helix-turn-helix domain-containing protein n=1 Tax=Streptomyces phyllanthi TaxID=1803180 RepID=A0A5N8VT83_9ACTN|nr:helix-turn-helix domain-containing protein [Streptomyces phyllanthi]MPY38447.1 helix-turn-helix domain-containing protein [Streptomyces phyllanthi]